MCPAGQVARSRHVPGKAKRDLLSVDDIWADDTEKQKEDKKCLYNVEDVDEERKWLLDLLLEESDADSGGEEQITDQDLREILKIHSKRRKFQKEYHSDLMNSQYTYYGAGLISAKDRFNENQQKIPSFFNFMPWLIQQRIQLLIYSPLILVGSLGIYAVLTVIYGVATFNDCKNARKELIKEVAEAKEDLRKRGIIE
uniref:Dolichol-phosphate mannose synthase subunit 3 n=1 Tax=Meloidogyne javanica TaxID=6303 RepID=A0A915MQQ7_MELJA